MNEYWVEGLAKVSGIEIHSRIKISAANAKQARIAANKLENFTVLRDSSITLAVPDASLVDSDDLDKKA